LADARQYWFSGCLSQFMCNCRVFIAADQSGHDYSNAQHS
jgi:hypothetical protein